MTRAEHDMLTKFLGMKPPNFVGSKTEDALKFMLIIIKGCIRYILLSRMLLSFLLSNDKVMPSSGREHIWSVIHQLCLL